MARRLKGLSAKGKNGMGHGERGDVPIPRRSMREMREMRRGMEFSSFFFAVRPFSAFRVALACLSPARRVE